METILGLTNNKELEFRTFTDIRQMERSYLKLLDQNNNVYTILRIQSNIKFKLIVAQNIYDIVKHLEDGHKYQRIVSFGTESMGLKEFAEAHISPLYKIKMRRKHV